MGASQLEEKKRQRGKKMERTKYTEKKKGKKKKLKKRKERRWEEYPSVMVVGIGYGYPSF